MSERISVATPPPIVSTVAPPHPADATVPLDRVAARDLARLTLGFSFVFWGALLTLAGLCESLMVPTLRLMPVLLLGAGSLALVTGAWRLHQVQGLDDSWRRRTREVLIVVALLAYLCPFYAMWRRLPTNTYLLGHVLAMLALFSYSLTLLCHTVSILGRAAGKRSLVIQAILFGTLSVVVLFPPFALLAQAMVVAARGGHDPFALVQFWLERMPPWIVLALLLPFSLTLSLIWAAKDLTLHRLLSTPDEPTMD